MAYISFEKFKEWFKKYERHISSVSLIAGFVIDNLTLKRIDLPFENFVLFSYLALAAGSIFLFNLYTRGKFKEKFLEKYGFVLPVVMQFAFGGLFSGFFVFYSRSASIFTSWPFLLILVAIMIFGELKSDFYKKETYQLSVLFVAFFSFLIFYVPVLIGKMGAFVFLLSGVISLVFFFIFLRIIYFRLETGKARKMRVVALLLFAIINIFYFTNVLPPIPLSLKDGGIYKSLSKIRNDYVLVGFENTFIDRLRLYKKVSYVSGEPVFAFSSVFAPTDLNTQIVHEWQYYESGKWITAGRIPFAITGGRDGGYRGYSIKTSIFPGKWRVNVETIKGQTIGRLRFRVI